MTTKRIDAASLREMLLDSEEAALLDVREEQEFGDEHLLYASSMPLGRLELAAPKLVPRLAARIVLCGDPHGRAETAAERLQHYGYTDVAVLNALARISGILAASSISTAHLLRGPNIAGKSIS